MFNFTHTNIPVHLSVSIFALTAVVIWFIAARITDIANAIISGTGAGQPSIGLPLADITSLSELNTWVTARSGLAALCFLH